MIFLFCLKYTFFSINDTRILTYLEYCYTFDTPRQNTLKKIVIVGQNPKTTETQVSLGYIEIENRLNGIDYSCIDNKYNYYPIKPPTNENCFLFFDALNF